MSDHTFDTSTRANRSINQSDTDHLLRMFERGTHYYNFIADKLIPGSVSRNSLTKTANQIVPKALRGVK